MNDTARCQIVRDAWRLSRPYWTSEEKIVGLGILLAVIALNLGNVYISMRINAWSEGKDEV
jgi:vitamin B12/bleomycin/antimicrobial peptide transport system ATP-binding/permease protein